MKIKNFIKDYSFLYFTMVNYLKKNIDKYNSGNFKDGVKNLIIAGTLAAVLGGCSTTVTYKSKTLEDGIHLTTSCIAKEGGNIIQKNFAYLKRDKIPNADKVHDDGSTWAQKKCKYNIYNTRTIVIDQ